MKFSLTDPREVKKFFVIFYCVGAFGLTVPALLPYFKALIPFALLLNFVYVLYFHTQKVTLRSLTVFALIFSIGMLVEIVGVETGLVFGEYTYGSSLGIQFYSVPLIIGVNWLFLTYASASMFEHSGMPVYLKIIGGAGVMLLYDIILEISAPYMDMWMFAGNVVPFANYLVWFVLGLLFHTMIRYARINTSNPIAVTVFLCQFFFFVVLAVVQKYIL